MMRARLKSRGVFSILVCLVTAGAATHCGGGQRIIPPDGGYGTGLLSGTVVKGPVASAVVSAYSVDASGARLSLLGEATTDASGAFTLTGLQTHNGPILLVASGGSYAEEAVAGAIIRLGSDELTYLLGNFQYGSAVSDISITPVSHLATGLATYWIRAEGKSIQGAIDEAWLHLNSHFGGLLGGGLDWRSVTPADFRDATTGQLDAAGRAGILLAALSMEARGIAERAGLTPGAALSSVALVEALYADVAADGYFDGQGASGQLLLPAGGYVADAGPTAYALNGHTLRLALGQALERFVQSSLNQSGLTSSDVLPLIQQLASNSAARIFRSAGMDFDHQPPVVTLAAKFARADGVLHEPVGALRLVGGTVTLTVDVTDASTIQAVTLTANGQPLTATTTGSGTQHLVLTASFPTTSDGPLALTASAVDVHGNATVPQSLTLTVDNTPPAIAVAPASPTAGAFYSAAVPLDATASDSNGVTDFTLAGLPGFNNLSGVTGRITGSWPVPAGQPDGPLTLTLTAMDSAFNVSTQEVALDVDRTPPTVSLAAPLPPRYTGAQSVTLRVSAQDAGANVAAVKASVNGAPEVTVTTPGPDGTWDVTVDLGLEGNKQVLLWAVDRSIPANSSYAAALPVTITRDATNPTPVVVTSVGAYFDERPESWSGTTYVPGMGLQLDGAGSPVVPPVYTFPASAGKVAVSGSQPVFKAATRLSWGPTAPTVAQLYSQDGAHLNVPFIVVEVPASSSEAPISPEATYAISCPACSSFPPATGALLRDEAFNPDLQQRQRFLLPLSVETIPGLASLSPGIQLVLTMSVSDAAGNLGGTSIRVDFHVIGPPLVWREETTAYVAAADPKSAYAYRMSPSNYHQLFNAGNAAFGPDGNVRLVRYVVENAAFVPIALTVSLGSPSVQQVESWNNTVQNMTSSQSNPAVQSSYSYDFCNSLWNDGSAPPCGAPPATRFGYWLYGGYYPSLNCTRPANVPDVGVTPYSSGSVATSGLNTTAYVNPQAGGGETAPAAIVPGASAFTVPAASGTTPGRLVVYLNRPASVVRSAPISRADVMANTSVPLGASAYSYTVADFWTQTVTTTCLGIYGGGRRHGRYLTTADTTASGTTTFTTSGLNGGTLFGEASAVATGRPFTVSFRH